MPDGVHETTLVSKSVRVEFFTVRWEDLRDAVGTITMWSKFYFHTGWHNLLAMPNPLEPAVSHRAIF